MRELPLLLSPISHIHHAYIYTHTDKNIWVPERMQRTHSVEGWRDEGWSTLMWNKEFSGVVEMPELYSFPLLLLLLFFFFFALHISISFSSAIRKPSSFRISLGLGGKTSTGLGWRFFFIEILCIVLKNLSKELLLKCFEGYSWSC